MTDLPHDDEWKAWFQRAWAQREEVLYPSLFGSGSRGIFPIPPDMFSGTFGQEAVDPRWLSCGVFEFAPTPARASWLYVTSGMSNDWEAAAPDPSTPSGLGCEFIFESTEQGDWAILRLLHLMTFQILLCHGRYPDREPLSDFDRVPLRGPIRPSGSLLTNLMLAPSPHLSEPAQLESGPFDIYHAVGISDAEAAYAREHSGDALLELLAAKSCFPVTNPDRDEIKMGTIK